MVNKPISIYVKSTNIGNKYQIILPTNSCIVFWKASYNSLTNKQVDSAFSRATVCDKVFCVFCNRLLNDFISHLRWYTFYNVQRFMSFCKGGGINSEFQDTHPYMGRCFPGRFMLYQVFVVLFSWLLVFRKKTGKASYPLIWFMRVQRILG